MLAVFATYNPSEAALTVLRLSLPVRPEAWMHAYNLLYSKLVVSQQHKYANGMDLSPWLRDQKLLRMPFNMPNIYVNLSINWLNQKTIQSWRLLVHLVILTMTLMVMNQLMIIQNKLSELDMPEPDQQTETV